MLSIHQLDAAVKFGLPEGTHVAGKGWQNDPPEPPYIQGKNYGIHCGKSKLIVIDADRHDEGADGVETFRAICESHGGIPETYTQATPRDGFHYVFYSDRSEELGKHTGKGAPWGGVDVIAGGAYIAGAGTYRDGIGEYTVYRDLPIAEMPEWLFEAILERVTFRATREVRENRGTGSVAYENMIDMLLQHGSSFDGVNWQCPAHDDRIPSLTVTDGGDRALFYCHSGCDWQEIMNVLDMELDDGFDDKKKTPWDAARAKFAEDNKIRMSQQEQEEPRSSRKLKLKPMSEIKMKKVKWAWDTTDEGQFEGTGGRFPVGTIAIGAGRPGAGKGQYAAWLGAQISNGTLPGCFYGKPKGVVIYSTEDSNSMTIAPRFKAAGADLNRVFIFERETENVGGMAMIRIKDDLEDLRDLIVENDIGLIILDPLISVLDGKTDVNQETAVRSELEPFQGMLETVDCFAFGIMHFRKMKDEDILNMFSGSGAFPRIVRAAVAFGAEKDDDGNETRVISTVKNNLGRTDLPSYTYAFETVPVHTDDGMSYVSKLVMTGEAAWSVEEMNENKQNGGKAKTAVDRAGLWLDDQLAHGAKLRDDIKMSFDLDVKSGGLDFSWTAVERSAKKLKVEISKDNFGGKSTWKAPF